MLILHNSFRELESLPPLIANDRLNKEASKHAKRMARLGWLSDYGLAENLSRLTEFEKIVCNISLGSNPEIACKGLINEPEARYKILGDYTQFGYGSYEGKKNIRYWCMLYANLRS